MDIMRFTKELKASLLERFSYKNRIHGGGGTFLVKIECPLCIKYSGCIECKSTHHHDCLTTLKKINKGDLHFKVNKYHVEWYRLDSIVVEKELRRIRCAIRNSDIIVT